jgi:hypothetical protein
VRILVGLLSLLWIRSVLVRRRGVEFLCHTFCPYGLGSRRFNVKGIAEFHAQCHSWNDAQGFFDVPPDFRAQIHCHSEL